MTHALTITLFITILAASIALIADMLAQDWERIVAAFAGECDE